MAAGPDDRLQSVGQGARPHQPVHRRERVLELLVGRFDARTLDELAATVADLPRHEPTPDPRPLVVAFCVALAVVIVFAVLYSLAR